MDGWKIVGGQMVTDLDFDLPPTLQNDFDSMGDETLWGPEGMIKQVLGSKGIQSEPKPLFSSVDRTFVYFEAENQLYAFITGAMELLIIRDPTTVQNLAMKLDESNGDLYAVDAEQA